MGGSKLLQKLYFRKKYFLKLFALVFVISLVTISVALYTAYYRYSSNLETERQAFITDSLSTTDQMFTTMLGEVDMLYTLSWTNDIVQDFLRSPAVSPESRQRTDEYLKSICELNAYVDSIVVYNSYADEYLCAGPKDIDMKLLLSTYLNDMSQRGSSNLSKQKHLFQYSGAQPGSEGAPGAEQSINVIYYSIDTNGKNHSCIAVSLNAAKVSEYLLKGLTNSGALINEFGTVIFSDSGAGEIPLGNCVRWSRQLAAESHRTGSFADEINGADKRVTYYKLSESAWTLYHISDGAPFRLLRGEACLHLLMIVLAAVLFSAAIAALLSTRLYRPVKGMVNRLNTEHSGHVGNHRQEGDEFSFVNAMVSNLSDRISTLESENTGYLNNIKASYLRRMLEDGDAPAPGADEWLLYAIDVLPENLMIAIVKLDEDSGGALGESGFSVLVAKSVERCLRQQYNVEAVAVGRGETALLMNPLAPGSAQQEELLAALEAFRRFLCGMMGLPLSVSIGYGGTAAALGECAARYRSAQELLKQRFVLGYGRLITWELVEGTLSRGPAYPGELIAELEADIREANKERFLLNCDRLLEVLRRYVYQDVVSVLLQVITRCLHTMNSISADNIPIQVDFDEFSLIFSSLHTLEHTRDWFSAMFDQYLRARKNLERMKDDKHYQLIEQIQQHVEEHYADPDLNIDQLAEVFGYTPSYISRIFKKITGLYLRDHIKDVRIRQAKKLLAGTSHSIQEISGMTGFANYNYFFSSFKKEIGLTPTHYRTRFPADPEQPARGGRELPAAAR